MREIKYRVWDKETESMYGSEYIDSINLDEGTVYCSSGGYNEIEWDLEIENAVFMQYTGLKDKNEQEIYEGDIVARGDFYYEVVWDEKNGWFGIDDYDYGLTVLSQYLDYVSVVGNIFENPELLKKG